MSLQLPAQRQWNVQLGGLLGEAADASIRGRLSNFIVDTDSDPLQLFSEEGRADGTKGDWYGEHVGKWLIAASRAAFRTGDEGLAERVRQVAGFLWERQEPSGYLGAYSADSPARFTSTSAESMRTWDVWVHAYALLGLLEVNRHWPDDKYIQTCLRTVDLLKSVFESAGRNITNYGNHQGLSSLILIHPLAELASATGDSVPAAFADRLVEQASDAGLKPIEKLLTGDDISTIGTGKIYQLCWMLLGLVRLGDVAHRPEFISAAKEGWASIREGHLTLGGGPWGGVGRHKEVFNDPGFFSPSGLVETCSSMAWIQLCRALHEAEPDPKYPEEIEKTLHNTVLGAMDPNGEDWAYFTFPNGPRNSTYYWACCKSSGAIALEEAPLAFFSEQAGGLSVDMFGPSRAELTLSDGSSAFIEQETSYPLGGDVLIRASGTKSLRVRIPSWAKGARVEVDGVAGPAAVAGEYASLQLEPARTTSIRLELPMKPCVHAAAETLGHHGQEILRKDYFAMTKGPLVYAAGLIDGYKKEETLRVPRLDSESRIEETADGLRLNLPGHKAVELEPYFRAGLKTPWRVTWLGVAWQ